MSATECKENLTSSDREMTARATYMGSVQPTREELLGWWEVGGGISRSTITMVDH